jgi:hypothetical protein
MYATIRAEIGKDGKFKIFLPDDSIAVCQDREHLKRFLYQHGLIGNAFSDFESRLLEHRKCEVSYSIGKPSATFG